MSYRKLTKEEISVMQDQGCRSPDWPAIEVKEGFTPDTIRNTSFDGKVRIGRTGRPVDTGKGFSWPSGIYNSHIRNCGIGDDVLISNVTHLDNYTTGNDVIIENAGVIQVNGETSFGNGTEIEILNEGGGRELPIFDRLNAQVAYLLATCRHDANFISSLSGIVRDYISSKSSSTGTIGNGVRIVNTRNITDTVIGDHAIVSGASLLENGTIASIKDAPAIIGTDVTCRNFIIHTGSKVDDGALLENCFIGQGVKIGKQFSAENSVFFANSEGFHGEAVSVFGGPYTVTHHKSTLLIASMYSFFNAGSGTNASNHLYKLGPLHQGIMERGSKTGSFSYLLWPCRIGCFTAVIGKHYANFDTSEFPFSYINEIEGKSWLTPALNLFTVGTRRDSVKWPQRDRRKDKDRLDLIHFRLLNPYTVGRIVSGIKVLNDLYEKTPKEQKNLLYKGIGMKRLMLKTSRKYYELALRIYFGEQVIARLEHCAGFSSIDNIRASLAVRSEDGAGSWMDASGMLMPLVVYQRLIDSVKQKEISSLAALEDVLRSVYNRYEDMEWTWCVHLIREIRGIDISQVTREELAGIIEDWKSNAEKLNNMILMDAEKEFDAGSKIGFGLDGDDNVRDADFESVRGTYDTNSFVTGLRQEIRDHAAKADELIKAILKG